MQGLQSYAQYSAHLALAIEVPGCWDPRMIDMVPCLMFSGFMLISLFSRIHQIANTGRIRYRTLFHEPGSLSDIISQISI